MNNTRRTFARLLSIFAASILAVFGVASPAWAVVSQGTITVNDDGDGSASGVCTLRNATNLVDGNTPTGSCSASGTVMPPEIVFSLPTPATIHLNAVLDLSHSMTITGPGEDLLTLSGAFGQPPTYHRVINFESGDGATLRMSKLSITDGVAPADSGGGAINSCCGNKLVLDHLHLYNNSTDFSGGAIHAGDDLDMSYVMVENNRAVDDSGIFLTSGGGVSVRGATANLDHVVIRDNTTGSTSSNGEPGLGGGLFVSQGSVVRITDSSISGNHAIAAFQSHQYNPYPDGGGGQGGGIANEGTVILERSTMRGNNASFQGGGLYNIADASIINSTVAQNSVPTNAVPSEGGGIFNESVNGFGYQVVLSVTNSTVFNNAATAGGGLYNKCISGTQVRISNSAFGAAGSGEVGGDIVNASGAALIGKSNMVEDGINAGGLIDCLAGNIVGRSAQFEGFGDHGGPTWTVSIPLTSPVVNAGDNALAVDAQAQPLTSDQRDAAPSIPRIFNGVVDIGALETASDFVFVDGFDHACDLIFINGFD